MEPKVGDKLICIDIPRYADSDEFGPFTINKTYIITMLSNNDEIILKNDRDNPWFFHYTNKSHKYYYTKYFTNDIKQIRKLKLKQLYEIKKRRKNSIL